MKDSKKGWRKKAREHLAAAFGGKCTICGYDKTISALDYHHLDPKEKDGALSVAMKNGYAWSKIVQEARKCTIVCCRCHREIHAGVTEVPNDCVRFNEVYVDKIKLLKKEFDRCPICGEEKNKRYKYCSVECSSQSQIRLEITKEELEMLVCEKPYEEIGKMFGVSGNTVKNKCKLLNIRTTIRRGYWSNIRKKDIGITKEQLIDLLKNKSVQAISDMLKVNHKTVRERIKEWKIEVPKINWHKEAGKARWK